jgi:asparagine synthetase B (glutamine-hydrolysing)
VAALLPATGRLGVALSGGVDSSVLLALAARSHPGLRIAGATEVTSPLGGLPAYQRVRDAGLTQSPGSRSPSPSSGAASART